MEMMIKPTPLKAGDTVAVIAPASCAKEKELVNAEKSLALLNLKGKFYPSSQARHGYLAGEDALRAKDLNDAFQDPEAKGIFCLRGGYGCGRLLPMIDFDGVSRNPKLFLGYSDVSVLHIAFNQICHLMTIHGTMPSINWERSDEYTVSFLKRCLFGFPEGIVENPEGEVMECLYPGKAQGRIIGGNLSLVVSTLGSPYEIDTKDKILFLEDIGEKPYNIDRMLTALSLAGKFRDASGVILGSFIDCEETEENTPALTLKEIFQEVIVSWKKPTILNFRCGHTYPQLTFPMGAITEMDAARCIVAFHEETSDRR